MTQAKSVALGVSNFNSSGVLGVAGGGTGSSTGYFASGTALVFKQTAAPTGWTKLTTDNDAALRIVSGSVSTGGTVGFTTAFASQAVTGTVGTTGSTTAVNNSYTPAGSIASTGSTTATNNSYTPAGSVGTSGATTLSESQMPSHGHSYRTQTPVGAPGGGPVGEVGGTVSTTGAAGGSGSHTHSGGSFSGTPATITQVGHTHTSGAFSGTPATITQTSHTHTSGAFTGTAINLAVKYVDVIMATKD